MKAKERSECSLEDRLQQISTRGDARSLHEGSYVLAALPPGKFLHVAKILGDVETDDTGEYYKVNYFKWPSKENESWVELDRVSFHTSISEIKAILNPPELVGSSGRRGKLLFRQLMELDSVAPWLRPHIDD